MNLTQFHLEKLKSGEDLAYRDKSQDSLSCWLMITPFKIHPETGMATLNAPGEPWKFRVRHFGIPQDFDYDNFDLHPEYVTNFINQVVVSLEQVERLISPIVQDPERLVEPRDCECPM
jgi:hypothetical protein